MMHQKIATKFPILFPKTLMSVPLKGPKLNPAITPITEVGIPGTAHMIAVKTNNSAAENHVNEFALIIVSYWL